MSLYLKDKNDELKKIAKEQKKAQKGRWKEAPKYSARILSAVGVLCVMAVIAGVAASMPLLLKAANASPGSNSWDDIGLGDYKFNKASGDIDELSDLKFLYAIVDGDFTGYAAAIETEDQLKAVLSGLKTSKTTAGGDTIQRNDKVMFKLTRDFELEDWMLDGTTSFEKDLFDGQGHTITCGYTGSKTSNLNNNSLYVGLLFGKVSDATIRNLQVDIKNYERNLNIYIPSARECYLGMGGVCGVAENAVFSDIEISGGWKVKYGNLDSSTYFDTDGILHIGLGGLIGIVQSGVKIIRCKDDSNIDVTVGRLSTYSGNLGVQIWGIGGITGQIVGTDNTMLACWGNGVYTYTDGAQYRKLLVDCGTIVGAVGSGGSVSIKDSAGRDDAAIIALEHENSGSISLDNCYGKNPYNYLKYRVDGVGEVHNPYVIYKKSELDTRYLAGSLSGKTVAIDLVDFSTMKGTNWGYNSMNGHFLLHPVSSNGYKVNLESLKIGDPLGEEHKITITGKVTLLDSSNNQINFPENAKVQLFMTVDGATDPWENTVPDASVSGAGQSEIELTTSANYSDPNKNLTVRVRIKVVFDEETNTDATVWWSPLYEKEFDESDLYIDEPTLQVSIDNQAYEDFRATTAYPLGTTKLQLTGNGEAEYTMYYDFRDRSGLVLGETDSNSTIFWQTMTQKNKYKDPFTLTEEMVKSASSNKVYMYVLAHIKKNNVDYYKLYEYEIVVFAKDKLITVTRDSGSKIPNGSTVTFKVGNGIENEYPYDKMNVLISEKQKQYRTLEGQSGVVTYVGNEGSEYKKGSGTAADPYYLTVDLPLSGKPGQTFYVYVEPCVNETGDYTSRYGRFVLEYTYTIMDKAAGLVLSPSTITMAQSGTPTVIPIKEKVFMNSGGNSDIIIYRMTTQAIEPVMVTSDATLQQIAAKTWTLAGENAYCWEDGDAQLYIRCNDQWYSISNADGKLQVYKDGSLSFDASYAGKTAYVSTVLFSAGYDPSDNWIYKYKVNEPDAVEAPVALLADGSSISMGKVLNFSCTQDCVMYYTKDGTDPTVTVSDTGAIQADNGTFYYDQATGIAVTTENGFSYGTDILIKLVAYPVLDASAATPIYNSNKKNSDISAFTYTIQEQSQVETPVAYPVTSTGNVAVVVKGSRISLSCATPGAEIYYTVNGGTPSTASDKYTGTIPVDGDYGSYFTVRAIAHKEGMKDSEVATCLYKIAEKDTVSSVTAIPSTTNQVIAGDKIILSTTEPGADIYYTTDGTTPDVIENEDENGNISFTVVAGEKYNTSESITVPEGSGYFVVHAIAVKADMTNSPVAQFIYSYAESVGAPYGNPSSGTVTENTEVVLRCANEDAIIYYEIAYGGAEPAVPTTSSAIFSEKAPIIITRDTKIKAFAFYNRQSSEIVTLSYKLAQKLETPTSSVNSGAIVPSGTTVKLSSNGGKVHYTTDGSDPSDSTNTAVNIGSEVVITGKAGDKVVIKTCTKESGTTTSEMTTFTYQISQYPGGVTTDTATGSTLSGGTSVHLMTDVTGGTIYYTTGSGSPITAGTAGNSVVVTGEAGADITVKAVAVAPGTTMTGSYASFTYKLMEQLAAPNASIKDGTRLTESTGIVLKANKGKIYFTIDGTEPTKASNEYTAPIVVSKATTIKAIAIMEGCVNSEISTFNYTFAEKVRSISASVPSGTVQAGEIVNLSCPTQGTKIYYTTDGTDPSRDAEEGVFLYDETEGISIHRSVNVKAIAVKDGMCASDVLSLNYQVDEVPVVLEREKAAEEEAAAELKPSDLTNLENRREQPMNGETADGDILLNDFISKLSVRGKLSGVSENVTLRAKEVSIPENAKKEIKRLMGDDYELLCNYDFALYDNGKQLQPEGPIEIGIPIPEEYEDADVTIISVNEKAGVKVYNTRREDGYAYAEVSRLSNYALVGAKLDENRLKELNLILITSIGAGILSFAGTGMIIRTVKRRKRY